MLEVRQLSVSYGDLRALWDVSFRVSAGELVAIIGPNGAGKTTTLRAILGLIPAAAGEIVFNGRHLNHEPSHRRVREGIALVPEGRRIFPYMSVLENLELAAHATGGSRDLEARLAQAFAVFPILAERRGQLAGTMSGGEQQMLAIGRALMARPRLLMLDEPSLGLAPVVVDRLYQTIRDLRAQGLTILLVEQYVYGALELADRAYVLEIGRITREGEGQELLHDDYVRKTYLVV
ncbi:MAG: ABC transporter ATP-binding protein [Armatimonadetes bacterium]|nr:ABC transporter ATP-binding protein [Armatimonadota bacterium]